MSKLCELDENKVCDACGQCNYCDLDPNKICDNCCKCLDDGKTDYRAINITKIITDEEEANKYRK